jgi:hypothetical protein
LVDRKWRLEMAAVEYNRVRATPDGRLKTPEAAKFLGVARKTLTNWRYTGKGPRVLRVGGQVFYKIEDLTVFIEANEK